METEREWREAEMRFFRNQFAGLTSDNERRVARKALVVMLYAHFEGASKTLLSMYVNRLNMLNLRVVDVAPALGATSQAAVFQALRNPNTKCKEFARSLPDDSALHKFARDSEFVELAWKFAKRKVKIDPDAIVDPESNLNPTVLRKILFRLGLDPKLADPWEGLIHQLLNRRNGVAHGEAHSGLEEKEYADLDRAVTSILDGLVLAISDAVSSQIYLSKGAKDPE